MTNFFSNVVENKSCETAAQSRARIAVQSRRSRGSTVPRFAGLVVVNLGLQNYTPPG